MSHLVFLYYGRILYHDFSPPSALRTVYEVWCQIEQPLAAQSGTTPHILHTTNLDDRATTEAAEASICLQLSAVWA